MSLGRLRRNLVIIKLFRWSGINKQIINNMEEKTLLGIMSAIIYAGIPQSAKDNGYAIINAVGQARELLNEISRQTK